MTTEFIIFYKMGFMVFVKICYLERINEIYKTSCLILLVYCTDDYKIAFA